MQQNLAPFWLRFLNKKRFLEGKVHSPFPVSAVLDFRRGIPTKIHEFVVKIALFLDYFEAEINPEC